MNKKNSNNSHKFLQNSMKVIPYTTHFLYRAGNIPQQPLINQYKL